MLQNTNLTSVTGIPRVAQLADVLLQLRVQVLTTADGRHARCPIENRRQWRLRRLADARIGDDGRNVGLRIHIDGLLIFCE